MRTKGGTGLTLTELLVVIAIIAVTALFAAILFPIFTAAPEPDKGSGCVANMKEQSRALAMYRDDYDGRMPRIWRHGKLQHGGIWNVMAKAGKDAKGILKCPSAPWINHVDVGDSIRRSTDGYAYQLNETGWKVENSGGTGVCLAHGLKDSQILRPSQLIYIAESMGWQGYGVAYHDGNNLNNETATDNSMAHNGPGWTGHWPRNNDVIPFNGDAAGPRGGTECKIYNLGVSHGGSTNVLFYDGHIKSMTTSLGKNWGNGDNP